MKSTFFCFIWSKKQKKDFPLTLRENEMQFIFQTHLNLLLDGQKVIQSFLKWGFKRRRSDYSSIWSLDFEIPLT